MNFRNNQIALVFFLLSPLAMAAEITATCPAFNDGTNTNPDLEFHGSWMCAYVSPGQQVFNYISGGGNDLGMCGFGSVGSNMSLLHCPTTTHGASVPSISCELTIPDEVGGTVQWVPYQGSNWAYLKERGAAAYCESGLVYIVVYPPPNPVPVDPVSCTATSVSIDHKNITPQEFNGSIASGKTTVSCSGGDGSVKLSFTTSSINLSNGGKSNLHFNNATGETTTTFTFSEDSSKTIDIYSVLSGTVSPGSFSGSTSLIMNVN
jgi:hypothetical protein